jgi:hypothetical protein
MTFAVLSLLTPGRFQKILKNKKELGVINAGQ